MVDRDFIRKILTDPKLRKTLETDPKRVLGPYITRQELQTIQKVLTQVRGLENQIAALADTVLCTDPPPCGVG